jgi:cysteinyl-tRNA synthetase
MSTKYLRETFDIHGGGADLQFPHHENEIAQSTCANPGSHYARYWVHNGFLTVENEKMSKSLGNFVTVHDLLATGFSGEVIRYALLATHYRKPLDWTKKGLADAQKAMNRFYSLLNKENDEKELSPPEDFVIALEDDINTPKALSLLHHYAQEGDHQSLLAAGKMIGLFYSDIATWNNNPISKTLDNDSTAIIEKLIAQRSEAKAVKDWKTADAIRQKLLDMEIILEDKPNGVTDWKKQ